MLGGTVCRCGILDREDTCIVENLVFGHLLVRFEAIAGQHLIHLLDADEAVGEDAFLVLVPVQQLGVELVAFLAADVYIAAQLPQSFLVIIICGVCLDAGLDMKQGIELFEVDTFLEGPIG